MSTDAKVSITVAFLGDVNGVSVYSDGDNPTSPAITNLVDLAMGDNTITVPTIPGTFTNSLLILPPSGNIVQMTIKGINADTGIPISKTDPTKIAFETAPATIVINAASVLNGLRLIWT